MTSLMRTTNTLFDNLISDIFYEPPLTTARPYTARRQNGQIVNGIDDWQVVFAVPGVKPEEVEVKVEENLLNVSYDPTNSPGDSSLVSSFSRTWSLERDVNIDNIVATHENGVLTITIPKPESKKRVSRVIDVVPLSAQGKLKK